MRYALATLLLLLLHDYGQSQSQITASTPHVRILVDNVCGSGTIVGQDDQGAWILTNAHVAGTQLGREVNVDIVATQPPTRTTGHIRYSGYSATRSIDYAIIYAPGLSTAAPKPLLRTEPKQIPFWTRGSPRCVWPQVTKPFNDPQRYGTAIITGLPNAIGGQSGSAIVDANDNTVGLLTWSINGRCAAQTTQNIWLVTSEGTLQAAERRPEGLRELETASERSPTVEALQATLAVPVHELPIWTDGDQPDPKPDPTPPCCCCCGKPPKG